MEIGKYSHHRKQTNDEDRKFTLEYKESKKLVKKFTDYQTLKENKN